MATASSSDIPHIRCTGRRSGRALIIIAILPADAGSAVFPPFSPCRRHPIRLTPPSKGAAAAAPAGSMSSDDGDMIADPPRLPLCRSISAPTFKCVIPHSGKISCIERGFRGQLMEHRASQFVGHNILLPGSVFSMARVVVFIVQAVEMCICSAQLVAGDCCLILLLAR